MAKWFDTHLKEAGATKKNIPMVVFRSLVGLVYRKSLQISSFSYPICSMYSIFTYIWVIFRVHVGEYTIHGASGHELVSSCGSPLSINQQHISVLARKGPNVHAASCWLLTIQLSTFPLQRSSPLISCKPAGGLQNPWWQWSFSTLNCFHCYCGTMACHATDLRSGTAWTFWAVSPLRYDISLSLYNMCIYNMWIYIYVSSY